ncbi:transposase [Archangium gephyra]|nr:transposase [Archangium gephyra]
MATSDEARHPAVAGHCSLFSHPRVCDENPFSEAPFRTRKYHPSSSDKPFSSLEEARSWVASFVGWYDCLHRHSAIRFVTPDDRHFGREAQLLAQRNQVYQRARRRYPERWRGNTHDWTPVGPVRLNPSPHSTPTGPSFLLSA